MVNVIVLRFENLLSGSFVIPVCPIKMIEKHQINLKDIVKLKDLSLQNEFQGLILGGQQILSVGNISDRCVPHQKYFEDQVSR